MGAKRKIRFISDKEVLEFDSFTDARRYFGLTSGNFPDSCVQRGRYKNWYVEADETPYHGMYRSSMYSSWAAMKTRCTNPNIPQWNDYGGRGISLCAEWYDFKEFMKWSLSNGWEEGLTIERIDVNKGYCPENCCWISREQQQGNKRNNVWFEVDGEKKTLTELCRENNISPATVRHRLGFGWSIEDALTRPKKEWPKSLEIEGFGKTMSARKWSKEMGIDATTISERIHHGWDVEDALTMPPDVRNRKQKAHIPWRNN